MLMFDLIIEQFTSAIKEITLPYSDISFVITFLHFYLLATLLGIALSILITINVEKTNKRIWYVIALTFVINYPISLGLIYLINFIEGIL